MKDTKIINGITYTEHDGLYYPDLALPVQTDYPIGKYGQMRLDFLKKHRKGTYTSLLVAFNLNAHLAEIDREARTQVENLTAELAKQRGIRRRLSFWAVLFLLQPYLILSSVISPISICVISVPNTIHRLPCSKILMCFSKV